MHAKSALYANFMLDKLLSGLGDHGRYPTKIWSDMKTELVSDETITKDGAASLQRGVETVGGKLYLTDQRLIFEPQRINIQRGATVVLFEDISNTTLCWTKIINLIPVAPNSLAISTTDVEHRFVVFGRKDWKAAIDKQRSGILK